MDNNKFIKYIELINRVKKGLAIDIIWETDIEKIKLEFPNLRSNVEFNDSLEIKYLAKNEYNYYETNNGIFPFCDDSMIDLVDFIESGKKIIPPLISQEAEMNEWVIDNKQIIVRDGNHRLRLAREMGIEQIPFLISTNPKIKHYRFKIKDNDFKIKDGILTVSHENQKIDLNLSEYKVDQQDIGGSCGIYIYSTK